VGVERNKGAKLWTAFHRLNIKKYTVISRYRSCSNIPIHGVRYWS